LFFRDSDAQTYLAEQVEAGATVQLVKITVEDAREKLSKIMGRDRLEPPLGLDRSMLRDGLVTKSWDVYGRARSRHGNRSNPMERTFTALEDGDPKKMNRNSYLAVVESCAEVPLGLTACELRAAFHIVVGQL
jgi:hypothetical protein